MTSRAFRIGVVVAVSSVVSIMLGCVDEDPIISGHRTDAGPTTEAGSDSGPGTTPIQTIVPADDFDGGAAGDVDDPKCRKCAETLDTDKPRGTLCRRNNAGGSGISSVQTLNALVACVCYDKCPSKCGNYCSGGKTDLVCSACITQGCSAQIGACQADL